jgi:hypothetical protein
VTPLPIDDALPGLIDALSTRRAALVVAPPGSGKTTRVPPALLDSGRFSGKILLLQPRRVAARLCAARMAFERGQRVGEEIGSASVELAEELALTTAELSYLQDRRQAYYNLAERTNHPGVKGVATALVQAEKYGTPMGSALRVMAKENREMRITEAEKKAAALPAKLTVPMIVFFLPVLFLVILGPAFIKIDTMGIGKTKSGATVEAESSK